MSSTGHELTWWDRGDRIALWLLVLGAAFVLGTLALRADRDPPALIAPVCVDVPSKAAVKAVKP